MNYKACAKVLLSHDNILIITHKNPDGDTVGSAAALCSFLRRLGKKAALYRNPQVTEKLMAYTADFFADEDFEAKYIVAVDTATEGLFPRGFEGKVDLCIDHHPTNSGYAKELLCGPEKASCAEVVFELSESLGLVPNAEEATLLYIALSTDCGSFQYHNTKADTLLAASKLVALGADNATVNTVFFRKVSMARIKLESMIYSGMTFHREGKIAVAIISQEMMRYSGATEDDLDDLAGLAGRAEGTLLNITIREQEDGSSKVSVRSTKDVSSSDICAVFGGGGHAMAAGCTIFGEPEKAKEMLLNVVDEVWK